MEARTAGPQSTPDEDPGLPDDAPAGVRKAEAGNGQEKTITPQEEREAMRYLLSSAGKPMEYTAPVEWETDNGPKKIPWRLRSLPAREIDRIETENRQEGSNPFEGLKEPNASAALVAAATVFPDIRSEEFRRPPEPTDTNPDRIADADPADALMRVFEFQSGLLSGLAGEVRRISGFDPQRVGMAKRSLTRAVGNSSS